MCVICKQARRSGRGWGGMTDAWLPAAAVPGARKEGPPLRCGKRAFVKAVAQQPGGARRSEVTRYCPHSLFALRGNNASCPIQHAVALAGCLRPLFLVPGARRGLR